AAHWIAADAADQPPVAIGHRDDLRAVGPDHHGAAVVAGPLHPDVARAIAEAGHLIMPPELLAAPVANDDASRPPDDGAAILLHFAAIVAQCIEALRALWRGALRQRLDRNRRRRRQWCSHLWRRSPRKVGRSLCALLARTGCRRWWRCRLRRRGRWS